MKVVLLIGIEYLVTGFYDPLNRNWERKTWQLLKHLPKGHHESWAIIGSFNAIFFFAADKEGGIDPLDVLLNDFREMLDEC